MKSESVLGGANKSIDSSEIPHLLHQLREKLAGLRELANEANLRFSTVMRQEGADVSQSAVRTSPQSPLAGELYDGILTVETVGEILTSMIKRCAL